MIRIYSDDVIDNFDFPLHIEKDTEKIKKPTFKVYFIMENNTKADYITFSMGDPSIYKNFTFCLHSLYLLPQYQRRGVGNKAINLVKDYYENNSINKFYNQCKPITLMPLTVIRNLVALLNMRI